MVAVRALLHGYVVDVPLEPKARVNEHGDGPLLALRPARACRRSLLSRSAEGGQADDAPVAAPFTLGTCRIITSSPVSFVSS